MTDADFGNRGNVPTPGALRASIDRAIAEIDRQAALPAGHPEVLRAFMFGRRRLITPATMSAADVAHLEQLAAEGLAAELGASVGAEAVDELGRDEP